MIFGEESAEHMQVQATRFKYKFKIKKNNGEADTSPCSEVKIRCSREAIFSSRIEFEYLSRHVLSSR